MAIVQSWSGPPTTLNTDFNKLQCNPNLNTGSDPCLVLITEFVKDSVTPPSCWMSVGGLTRIWASASAAVPACVHAGHLQLHSPSSGPSAEASFHILATDAQLSRTTLEFPLSVAHIRVHNMSRHALRSLHPSACGLRAGGTS